jgi:hypothetical protein
VPLYVIIYIYFFLKIKKFESTKETEMKLYIRGCLKTFISNSILKHLTFNGADNTYNITKTEFLDAIIGTFDICLLFLNLELCTFFSFFNAGSASNKFIMSSQDDITNAIKNYIRNTKNNIRKEVKRKTQKSVIQIENADRN